MTKAELLATADRDDARSANPAPRRMLNETQVLAIVPVSRTTLYRMIKAGRFPRGIYISPNRRVWYEDEIVAWQNAVDEFDPNRRRGKGVGMIQNREVDRARFRGQNRAPRGTVYPSKQAKPGS
jgi:prophage regulatory protein